MRGANHKMAAEFANVQLAKIERRLLVCVLYHQEVTGIGQKGGNIDDCQPNDVAFFCWLTTAVSVTLSGLFPYTTHPIFFPTWTGSFPWDLMIYKCRKEKGCRVKA